MDIVACYLYYVNYLSQTQLVRGVFVTYLLTMSSTSSMMSLSEELVQATCNTLQPLSFLTFGSMIGAKFSVQSSHKCD